jgi:hypothetical protein
MFASSRDQVGRKPSRLESGLSTDPSAFIVHSLVEPGLRPQSDSKTILVPSGDQLAPWSLPAACVRRLRPDPSARTTKTSNRALGGLIDSGLEIGVDVEGELHAVRRPGGILATDRCETGLVGAVGVHHPDVGKDSSAGRGERDLHAVG